jgi:predicted DNA-binding transcriptional regulator YafY
MLSLLRTGEWRIQELAIELRANVRTVYRLLRAFRAAGIRLSVRQDGAARYYHLPASELRRSLGVRS